MADVLRKPALSGSVSHCPGKKVTQCRYNILSCQRLTPIGRRNVLLLHPWYAAKKDAWYPQTTNHRQRYHDGIVKRHDGG